MGGSSYLLFSSKRSKIWIKIIFSLVLDFLTHCLRQLRWRHNRWKQKAILPYLYLDTVYPENEIEGIFYILSLGRKLRVFYLHRFPIFQEFAPYLTNPTLLPTYRNCTIEATVQKKCRTHCSAGQASIVLAGTFILYSFFSGNVKRKEKDMHITCYNNP